MNQTISVEEGVATISEVLHEKYPYIVSILDEVSATENGIVQMELRVYNGTVTDLVLTRAKRFSYKK